MKKRILLLLITIMLVLCSCSGQEKKTVAPDEVPDDLIAVLPSGDELYIYMDRSIVEQLIQSQGIQNDRRLVNYDDLDLEVGYIDDKLVYMSFGKKSKIYLKFGISAATKIDELKDAGYEIYENSRFSFAVKRYMHDEDRFTETSENVGGKAKPFEYTNIDVNFKDGMVDNVSFFDLYAGMTLKFDE